MQVDRQQQADLKARAKAARAGKHFIRGNGTGRSLVKGRKLNISAAKSEDKCPRHYAQMKARNRG
jgi:hypothetical protein